MMFIFGFLSLPLVLDCMGSFGCAGSCPSVDETMCVIGFLFSTDDMGTHTPQYIGTRFTGSCQRWCRVSGVERPTAPSSVRREVSNALIDMSTLSHSGPGRARLSGGQYQRVNDTEVLLTGTPSISAPPLAASSHTGARSRACPPTPPCTRCPIGRVGLRRLEGHR
jgi:hypothetical protein